MTWRYSVTFENPETAPPETVYGTVASSGITTAAARAVRAAKAQRPGKRFEALLIMLEKDIG